MSDLVQGALYPAVRPRDIRNFEIPLAPLNEQKRITEKLDSLLARVDSCQSHLERVPQILKRFRQSVLAKARTGELTEDWRSSEKLKNWTFERAEDVCEKVQSGGTPKEGFIDKAGIPFLKVYNIVNQKIDFHYRPQYITKEIQTGSMSKSQTKPGDVLMNIVGPPLGKVAIVPDEFSDWNVNQAITLFRPSERIISKWIYYFLCSGYSISEIVHETRGMVGQTNISLSQCRNFIFPVPPLEEQAEIVRRVEKLFAYAAKLETRYTSASEHVERLTPSLLAKAFRGELVRQE
jgi:type I restriction enzyme S subunit